MPSLSTADHRVSPPRIAIPREYNAAHDLIGRNLAAERVNRCANALMGLGLLTEERVLVSAQVLPKVSRRKSRARSGTSSATSAPTASQR